MTQNNPSVIQYDIYIYLYFRKFVHSIHGREEKIPVVQICYESFSAKLASSTNRVSNHHAIGEIFRMRVKTNYYIFPVFSNQCKKLRYLSRIFTNY